MSHKITENSPWERILSKYLIQPDDDTSQLAADLYIDALNLRCPLPLLKLKQGLNALAVGQSVELTATDAASFKDFQAYMRLSPHSMLYVKQQEVNGVDQFCYLVRKGGWDDKCV